MFTIIKIFVTSVLILAMFISPTSYSASALSGTKTINLIAKDGQRIAIGTLEFLPLVDKVKYQLDMDHTRFKDYFLSMKEMKCLEGPELWCHIRYPYPQPRTITPVDLRWLEHDLLFMFKKSNEFGANFWNGVYYSLTIRDGVIVGEAQAIDLNLLAAPPEDLNTPFYSEDLRDEIERVQRWLPDIEIR
ncbi:hypothetical protein [Colwellia psychrerythraea]|uniref:Lipoprotein n=1 Tax=Colwellia psychrerythraea TaxID=28229 RepID=A0A099K8I4_COLPS|nr:hypothetical protein [Colwellia psychrerythraea]KGJ86407.1 hypothetical protein ND2E_0973 [Colwellia psychrerythraea]